MVMGDGGIGFASEGDIVNKCQRARKLGGIGCGWMVQRRIIGPSNFNDF